MCECRTEQEIHSAGNNCERGERKGMEAAVNSHLFNVQSVLASVICAVLSLGHAPQHSFSLTSAAKPKVEPQRIYSVQDQLGSAVHSYIIKPASHYTDTVQVQWSLCVFS